MKAKHLIVFDMDGVIVDVSDSYRDVVRQAARLFFGPARASEKLPNPLFELSDLALVKQGGGLNNDWDLTRQVIDLLFALVEKPVVQGSQDPWSRYRDTLNRCDVTALASYLAETPQPLKTLVRQKNRSEDVFIGCLYRGDVGSGNIIKQIFQELYLGEVLFRSTYHLTPQIYRGQGYILREKVLVDREVLAELSSEHILAIATGRPKAEAEYPLNSFDLKKYFSVIYTLDDCLKEEKRIFETEGRAVALSKPNPFMLDAIAAGRLDQVGKLYYIGDMPDDMRAAARSCFGYKSIGILISAPDKASLRKELRHAGAGYIIEDFRQLKAILEK
jgi:phosphoglycolate phosphatase-like HAD superfamily hydrolase